MPNLSSIRKILVTSALPYANGPIHLGHLLEYIQTDIWVRFQKLLGHQCTYVCADDAHGTAIMLKAEQLGITAETLIAQVNHEHQADFKKFLIEFDNYYSTHSPENQTLSNLIYSRLLKNGHITTRSIKQFYDPEKQLFLADRFIKGTCPRCKTENQYGDNCEVCSATYSPAELINPRSAISGAVPIEKESVHYFFKLPDFASMLSEWTRAGHLQPQIANKLEEWFQAGLQEWDISRDAPYFGFPIPDAPDKYFYVWLDAPIGYMASFQKLCDQRADLRFEDYWSTQSNAELYHFIGKDIVYFHALFWPAMLTGADFRTPTAIFAHGFVTINGEKMSKSRGTFIKASTYLNHLAPEYLRYYFAAKLSSGVEDLDLNLEDFVQRVNAELIGKIVNIASRCASFIHKYFQGQLAATVNCELLAELLAAAEPLAALYEQREFSKAIREIMALADKVNLYIDQHKPWVLAKDPHQQAQVQQVCSAALNLFRLLTLYLKPVLPEMAHKVELFLNCAPLTWHNKDQLLLNHSINPFQPLLQRIDPAQIAKMLQEAAV